MSILETAAVEKMNARNREYFGIDQQIIRPRDLRRMQERDAVTASLESIIEDVLAPITRGPRKLVISKQGDYYRARYEGRPTSVFVWEPAHAAKKLRCFDGEDQ